ncbi:cation:proton antiporter [Armatimonas rosea]|uniref:Kef-type K+ transport system membrane component KefB n=1 Tax=Armatimonas rosea TaxID=685828 RepID=A0A7W9SRU4_ARMRO|nr:cation:proton antiporter [Armatimonas rosea]MBB6051546.1 Kef-type K+ transport system membrane component KefB [Armatimonas rosea]
MPLADPLSQVLLALAAVIVTGLLLGRVLRFFGQPPVIGEIVAGIVLGPSLLGARFSGMLLPSSVAPLLGIIAQLGILLYMFTVGLELSGEALRKRTTTLITTSLASLLVPFVLGAGLGVLLYPRYSGGAGGSLGFVLFVGISLCVTAFPVLARILSERQLLKTELGSLALTSAAVGDGAAWCLLALVVGVVQVKVGVGLRVGLLAAVYLGVMLFVVRPLVRRLVASWERTPLTPTRGALVLVGVLLSALTTEQIGIHAIFGAFLFGAILPSESKLAHTLTQQLQPVVTTLLLPAFFALTGMKTRIDLLSGAGTWLVCGGIILVATLGKVGGTFFAARGTGVGARDALVLGALMNTRGLMELIVLNIGLDLHVLSPVLFAMLVVMALTTTMMTAPALNGLLPTGRKT